jgi:hypothetical protein
MTRGALVAVHALYCMFAVGCTEPDPRYCASNADCGDAGKVCNSKHFCEDGAGDGGSDAGGCASAAECADPRAPVCRGGACVPCKDASDDGACAQHGALVCGAGGACVQCRDAQQCAGKTPVCTSSGVCTRCGAQGDCRSLVCNDDGSCADPAAIVYVDRDGCMQQAATGDRQHPYCQIGDAVGKGKPIRVLGSAGAYANVDLAQSATLIGPGLDESPPARVAGGAFPGINVTGNGVTVLVDGFDVTASTVDGIVCSNAQLGPSLTVVRSSVHGVTGAGLSASKCTLAIDRSRFGPMNGGGGLALSGTVYKITNTLVVENGPNGPGVSFGAGSSGTFAHGTVAGNQAGMMAGGIDCGAAAKKIENSIVWGNGKALGTQLFGQCQLWYVDIDEMPMNGNNLLMGDPLLDTGWRLKDGSPCIDAAPTSTVDHDIDGTFRPQRMAFDLGAHEKK